MKIRFFAKRICIVDWHDSHGPVEIDHLLLLMEKSIMYSYHLKSRVEYPLEILQRPPVELFMVEVTGDMHLDDLVDEDFSDFSHGLIPIEPLRDAWIVF